MKKMKKFAALLLAVSMAAGMVACGSSDKKEETTKKEETKKDDKETKKLEGTLKVVTTAVPIPTASPSFCHLFIY